ncbi:Hsp70 protein that interacts with Zuo1p [Xanthoria parietina]
MTVEENNGVDPEETLAIGISFGNSNSGIAYTTAEGKAEVIANEEGDRQIPSILSYIGGEEFHGTQAKAQLVRNSQNTVAYFRDYIGKEFESIDPTPCHASAHPQKHDSTVSFSIQDVGADSPHDVSVSEITTRHIRRLASSASDYLGKKVNATVITVPTNFSDAQKEALSKSASSAGVDLLQVIPEPVSAVLAYDARPESKISDKLVVVADFGGTRSDVAVIASRGGMYSILSTAHDYSLGGAQLDNVLIDHFAKEFLKKNKSSSDPRSSPRGLAKLRLEAEATKRALSIGATASLSVESLSDGLDFSSTINRTRYEMLASKVFASFTKLIEEAVRKAELDVLDINEVILSGGTSHTPRIAANLSSLFPPTTTVLSPSTSATAINPSDLAARGAAIQASLIQEFEKEDIEQSSHPMVTVTPHLSRAIGVLVVSENVEKGVFRPLAEAETGVPLRRAGEFAVPRDGGDVIIKICEGISHIKVSKPPAKPKGEKKTNGKAASDDEDDLSDEDESEDEPEDVREKAWKVGNVLAETTIKGVKKGGKVEISVTVNADLTVLVTAREVGGKAGNGVRGRLEKPQVTENGSA